MDRVKVGNTKGIAKLKITPSNIKKGVIWFSVKLCIQTDAFNDRDLFLYPNDCCKTDKEFQPDCLVYTLFHDQNRISSNHGINHWIPFREEAVNAQDNFQRHFMSDYIKDDKLVFSKEAHEGFGGRP